MKLRPVTQPPAEEPAPRASTTALLKPIPPDAPLPVFPRVENGGWKELLLDEHPLFHVDIDAGAFLWLWQLVEQRGDMEHRVTLRGMGGEFQHNYASATIRARNAFREAARMHYPLPKPQAEPETPTKKTKKGKK